MVEQVLVLAVRDNKGPCGTIRGQDFYLLATPQIVQAFKGRMALINKANTVAWATSLAGIVARLPRGARIVGEATYTAAGA